MTKFIKSFISIFLLLIIWIGIEIIFDIPERYLPSPMSVINAIIDLQEKLPWHILATTTRIGISLVLGILFGIFGTLTLHRLKLLQFFMPSFNALRAVPPVALIPFFLLWFGFSEIGRIILLTLGLGINVLVASANVVHFPSEHDKILFRSFNIPINKLVLHWWLPRILESILPTLRFGLATVIGVVVVAEMLGSQTGLGYLIQTSRATFSLNVIFLATAIFGILTSLLDNALIYLWNKIVFWRK